MRRSTLALIFFTIGTPAVHAQQGAKSSALIVPHFDISLGYNYIRANAPPAGCDCFSLNGGYLSAGFHVTRLLSVAAEVTGAHSSKISGLGQDLTLITYMAGPRISLPGHRFVPFGQALFGAAHGSNSYFPSGTTSSPSAIGFALTGGGGLDVNLTHRFAVRAFDAEYLRTTFPNGTSSNWQNHLMIGGGIVVKFGGQAQVASVPVARSMPNQFAFTCASEISSVVQGDTLRIIGHVKTEPDAMEVNYTWTSDGGTIEGSGRLVTIKTTNVSVGDYHVKGQASLVTSPSTTADCQAAFNVRARAPAVAAPVEPSAAESAKNDVVFHENVQDALFDYDSYKIRPDAQVAIDHAAVYLKDHPTISVLIGGYSDERGSAEYNVALSENRANAAREALIAAGIDGSRLQIISYGKETQVCGAETDACWQRNRRAAFSMHP